MNDIVKLQRGEWRKASWRSNMEVEAWTELPTIQRQPALRRGGSVPALDGRVPAKLALALMCVLDWTNPDGRIRDAYIPGWLRDFCDAAIGTVPMDSIQAEYKRNRDHYPIGLLERWDLCLLVREVDAARERVSGYTEQQRADLEARARTKVKGQQ